MKTDLFIYLFTDGIIDRSQQNDLFHTCGTAMKKKIFPPKPYPQVQKNYAIHKISMSTFYFFHPFFSHPMPIKSLSVHFSVTYNTKFSYIPMISSSYLCHLVLVSSSCKFIARIAAINYFSSACNCQSESGCISPAVI